MSRNPSRSSRFSHPISASRKHNGLFGLRACFTLIFIWFFFYRLIFSPCSYLKILHLFPLVVQLPFSGGEKTFCTFSSEPNVNWPIKSQVAPRMHAECRCQTVFKKIERKRNITVNTYSPSLCLLFGICFKFINFCHPCRFEKNSPFHQSNFSFYILFHYLNVYHLLSFFSTFLPLSSFSYNQKGKQMKLYYLLLFRKALENGDSRPSVRPLLAARKSRSRGGQERKKRRRNTSSSTSVLVSTAAQLSVPAFRSADGGQGNWRNCSVISLSVWRPTFRLAKPFTRHLFFFISFVFPSFYYFSLLQFSTFFSFSRLSRMFQVPFYSLCF